MSQDCSLSFRAMSVICLYIRWIKFLNYEGKSECTHRHRTAGVLGSAPSRAASGWLCGPFHLPPI